MVECISYESVNGLRFGASPDEAIKIIGEPKKTRRKAKETILYYKIIKSNDYDYIIHFDDEEGFTEFELTPKINATLNGLKLGWTLKEVLNIIVLDNNPLVYDDDSIILYDFGVIFGAFLYSDNDFSDKSILFFKKGYRDDLKKYARPFSIEYAKELIKKKHLNIKL